MVTLGEGSEDGQVRAQFDTALIGTSSLCNLCVLCVSVVVVPCPPVTTESTENERLREKSKLEHYPQSVTAP